MGLPSICEAGVRFHSGVRVKGKDLQAFDFLLTQTSHYYPAGECRRLYLTLTRKDTKTKLLLKIKMVGAGEKAQPWGHWLLFKGTRVLLLAPKWQLLLTQAPGSYTFFRLPWHYMHVVYRHICRQNTHIHKSIFYFKNLNRKICFITWIQQCHLVSFIQIWKQTQSHDFLSEEQAVPRDVNNMTGWELYQRELWNYFIKARPLLKKN